MAVQSNIMLPTFVEASMIGMSKRTTYGKKYCPDVHFVWTSACICDYPADVVLSADRFLLVYTDGKNAFAQMRVPVDVAQMWIGHTLRKRREVSVKARFRRKAVRVLCIKR